MVSYGITGLATWTVATGTLIMYFGASPTVGAISGTLAMLIAIAVITFGRKHDA